MNFEYGFRFSERRVGLCEFSENILLCLKMEVLRASIVLVGDKFTFE